MGFIVGKAYPIIKSMADGGNQEAKNLLNGLDKMDQSKVDEIVSSLLGGGQTNKPSSFTDVATSKETSSTKVEKKSQVKDPLGEENLQELFDAGLDVDGVINTVRKQMSEVELSPDDPLSAGDLQGVVEAFEMSYKPKPKTKSKPENFTELVSQDDEMLSPKTDEEKKEFDNAYENAVANRGEKGAKRLFNKTKKMLKSFGVKKFEDQLDFFIGMINDEKGMRGK